MIVMKNVTQYIGIGLPSHQIMINLQSIEGHGGYRGHCQLAIPTAIATKVEKAHEHGRRLINKAA